MSRYSSSSQAKPLWPVSSGRPSKADIPRCNHCGGARAFEFQVTTLHINQSVVQLSRYEFILNIFHEIRINLIDTVLFDLASGFTPVTILLPCERC